MQLTTMVDFCLLKYFSLNRITLQVAGMEGTCPICRGVFEEQCSRTRPQEYLSSSRTPKDDPQHTLQRRKGCHCRAPLTECPHLKLSLNHAEIRLLDRFCRKSEPEKLFWLEIHEFPRTEALLFQSRLLWSLFVRGYMKVKCLDPSVAEAMALRYSCVQRKRKRSQSRGSAPSPLKQTVRQRRLTS